MQLLGSTRINELRDEHTFARLASALESRLDSVGSQVYVGEQRLNSLEDEVTVDVLAAHYKAVYGDSLPSDYVPADSDRVNHSDDVITLSRAAKYFRDVANIVVDSGDLPSLPEGFSFVTQSTDYVVDGNGDYVIAETL